MTSHVPYGMEIAEDCATCPMRKDGFFCQMTSETLADFQKINSPARIRLGLSCSSRGRCRAECTCSARDV